MKFLEINEIWEWCGAHGVEIEEGRRPAKVPSLVYNAQELHGVHARTGREPAVASAAIRALGDWDECLLWVVLWGVWPSTEDWPQYYRLRGDHGERRSLRAAPGHLFEVTMRALLVQLFTLTLENGWEAYVLPSRAGEVVGIRVFASHDGWTEIQSSTPVEFRV